MCGDGVGGFECTCLVGDVAFDDAFDAVGVHFHIGFTDAVARLHDHDGRAIGMVFYFVYVMDAHALFAVESVDFDDDAFACQTADGGADTSCGRQVNTCLTACLFDFARLDDGPVYLSEITLADLSGHVGKVEVGIRNLIIVDMRTEVFVRGVRGAEFNGMSVGQHAVATLSCGCSGKDVDLKFFALRVFFLGFSGYLCRYAFRYASRCETAQSDGISVLDESSSFGCCDFVESHRVDCLIVIP